MTNKSRKKTYYQKNPWAPISGNVVIKMPRSSPTFSSKELDKVFNDVFKKKKIKW